MNAEKELHFLDHNEASLLVNSIPDNRHKALVLLMLDAGLRVSEAISLQFGNFDFNKKVLNVRSLKKRKASKDFANRQIPLSQRLFLCLADYAKEFQSVDSVTYLFPSPDSKRKHINRQAVFNYLKRLSFKRVNIQNLHPHALRHTFATSLVATGAEMTEIADMLGHQNLNTSRIYTHIPKEKLLKSITRAANRNGDRSSFFLKIFSFLFAKQPPSIYIPSQSATPIIGRNSELSNVSQLLSKDVNVILFGKYGTGKRLMLDSIKTDKKIITLDDTSGIKKSLIYMLMYLYQNDKDKVAALLFGDFEPDKVETKLSRQSIGYLCDCIKSIVEPKEYVLKIRQFDDVTKQSLKVIDQLKDTFVILTCATEISITKAPFFGNFEKIEIKNLNRLQTFELVHKLSASVSVGQHYEMYRDHIWGQTDGNPRAIIDMVERYKREPFLVTETIRNITHSGVIRELDCSFALVMLNATLAVMRYMTGELDNPALPLIGGAAMITLILTRAFVSRTKRTVI